MVPTRTQHAASGRLGGGAHVEHGSRLAGSQTRRPVAQADTGTQNRAGNAGDASLATMCGIAGLVQPQSAGGSTSAQAAVARMVEQLGHRGPDDSGMQVVEGPWAARVVLGHTRLAILDLSPAGRQPMRSPDGTRLITFNGEIYNFRDLRAQLGRADWR